MENIWKVILGVFISAMIIFSGLGILQANNDAAYAERYLYMVGNEISMSDFSDEVCDKKIEEARRNNYELKVHKMRVGEGKSMHTAYAILTMKYPYSISILNLQLTFTKQLIVY